MTMDRPIVRVQAVEKRFGKVTAVDRLSFEIGRGEIFALLGPNGAGKSTTVRMLMGIIRPDGGSIHYALSDDGEREPRPSELGYLPEDRGLYREVPIIDTLVYMGVIRGMSRAAARDAAARWLERMELGERMKDKVDALSKGNQQKVQFVASILHRPRFAVLDEPFSGLDPINQERFLSIIRELRDQGTTVLLSAHQMSLVERLADRVLLMNRGREVLHGSISEIKSAARASNKILLRLREAPDLSLFEAQPAVERAEWTDNGGVTLFLREQQSLSPLLAALASKLHIEAVHSEEVSLHDIYVRRVGEDGPVEAGPET